MTLGEQLIRVEFNPENNDDVALVKQEFAKLVDLLASKADMGVDSERNRLLNSAVYKLEEASLIAVKGITTKDEHSG